MNRSVLLLAVLCTLALAAPAPSATANPVYTTHHVVSLSSHDPTIAAGETVNALLEVESMCGLSGEVRPERTGPETIFLKIKSSHPALSGTLDPAEYQIDWSEHCLLGSEQYHFAQEVEITLAEDAPADTRITVHIELESSWDRHVTGSLEYITAASAGLGVAIPDAVLLPDGQGAVPATLTNDGNTDLQVTLDPSLRTLFGAQPDVQTLTLAPGASQTIEIRVSVQDGPGALGALLVDIRAVAVDDPDRILHQEDHRIALEVTAPSGMLSKDIEEAPTLPIGGTLAVALMGLAFAARRRLD